MGPKPKWYQGKVADMLRATGYVPLPRMWARKDQMEQIIAMCKENENHVNAVRRYCRELEEKEAHRKAQEDAAWAAAERSKQEDAAWAAAERSKQDDIQR